MSTLKPNRIRNARGSPDHIDVGGNSMTMEVMVMAGKTANISLEIDSGIKQRAMAVLEARGMSLSGAVRRMVTLGIMEHRIPFEVTRDPVFAGVGMTDCLAERYGIEKDMPVRSGIPTGIIVKMTPEFKKEMRDYCRDMCITPNALVHLFLGQVAFELRVPFDD